MCRRGIARHVSRVAETDAQVKTQSRDLGPEWGPTPGEQAKKSPSPTGSQDEVDG
jgi:hypothetical protein